MKHQTTRVGYVSIVCTTCHFDVFHVFIWYLSQFFIKSLKILLIIQLYKTYTVRGTPQFLICSPLFLLCFFYHFIFTLSNSLFRCARARSHIITHVLYLSPCHARAPNSIPSFLSVYPHFHFVSLRSFYHFICTSSSSLSKCARTLLLAHFVCLRVAPYL